MRTVKDGTQSIVLRRVNFGYDKGPLVFSDLSLRIEKPRGSGYVVGLMGDSGCGKSTLFKLLLQIKEIQSGEIILSPRNAVISYVPQEPILFEHLTPLENAMYFEKIERFRNRFDIISFEKISKTLNMVDLLKEAKSVSEISGGQRQRLSLLRALSIAPDILLLDEPLVGLDEKIKESFLKLIVQFAHEYQILVLYISHHRQELELIADEILYFVKHDKQAVSQICQNDIATFFKVPPTLSALYTSKRLDTNVLKVTINESKDILPFNYGIGKDPLCLSIPADSFRISERYGWQYNMKAKTNQYCFVKVDGYEDLLVLPASVLARATHARIYIEGMVDIYQNGAFIETIKVERNKVV